MTTFVVTREGVYRHEVCGVFSRREAAESAVLKYLSKEVDGYHSYFVLPCEVDREVEFNEQGIPLEASLSGREED